MEERLKKWRMILGEQSDPEELIRLNQAEQGMDAVLEALYDSEKKGDLGSSSPNVNRWLGDIRKYFPSSVVEVMQKDALERLKIDKILREPELLEMMEKNVYLASTLISLSHLIPVETRETARMVVKTIVNELLRRFHQPMRQAIEGAVKRSGRNLRPKPHEIDWNRTIRANLKNYQPEFATIIPHYLRGFSRKRPAMKHLILLVDQSGSMASSVVYASVFGSVIFSIPSLSTSFVVFDTEVVDLSEYLNDPVDLMFGVQLGGGTDINIALEYAKSIIQNPSDTVIFLITDLYEGGNEEEMLNNVKSIKYQGTQLIVLLALNDEGSPSFNRHLASQISALDIPAFGCTPERFPLLLAAAIEKRDIAELAR